MATVQYVVMRFETSVRNIDALDTKATWLGEIRFKTSDQVLAEVIHHTRATIELELSNGQRLSCQLLQQDSKSANRWTVSLGG